jgi:UPF0716 family protein affecting phage T7 exclusion
MGPTPLAQRVLAVIAWIVGVALTAGLLIFGFFIGAALLGLTAVGALIAWLRLRWRKPARPRDPAVIEGEFIVIRRE